jgi:prophage antirepressor-like protein
MVVLNSKVDDIFKAIYWNKPTGKQMHDVLEIISLGEEPMAIATDICDYLGIERRGNRRAIYDVLTTK